MEEDNEEKPTEVKPQEDVEMKDTEQQPQEKQKEDLEVKPTDEQNPKNIEESKSKPTEITLQKPPKPEEPKSADVVSSTQKPKLSTTSALFKPKETQEAPIQSIADPVKEVPKPAATTVAPRKKISLKDVENEIDNLDEFLTKNYIAEGAANQVTLPDNWESEFEEINKYVSIEVQLKELEDYFNDQLVKYEQK